MAKCNYCGQEGLTLIQNTVTGNWELFDKGMDAYHNTKRCKEIYYAKQQTEKRWSPEDLDDYNKKQRKKNAEPIRTYYTGSMKSTDPHKDDPIKQTDTVKKLCNCDLYLISPAHRHIPLFTFEHYPNGYKDIFWCCNCGYYLTDRQIETHFPDFLISEKAYK